MRKAMVEMVNGQYVINENTKRGMEYTLNELGVTYVWNTSAPKDGGYVSLLLFPDEHGLDRKVGTGRGEISFKTNTLKVYLDKCLDFYNVNKVAFDTVEHYSCSRKRDRETETKGLTQNAWIAFKNTLKAVSDTVEKTVEKNVDSIEKTA